LVLLQTKLNPRPLPL